MARSTMLTSSEQVQGAQRQALPLSGPASYVGLRACSTCPRVCLLQREMHRHPETVPKLSSSHCTQVRVKDRTQNPKGRLMSFKDLSSVSGGNDLVVV